MQKFKCENAIGTSNIMSNMYKFKSSGDIYNGYVFTSKWETSVSLDAKYYCVLTNRNGVIQSNPIAVYDYYYYISSRLLNPV